MALGRDLIHLCFLIERRYASHARWLGSAFARLDCAAELGPLRDAALESRSWREREGHLGGAYAAVAAMHNRLGVNDPRPTEVTPYHGRPFRVIHGDHFADAVRDRIADPRIRALPPDVGSIDQVVDSTDVLSNAERRRRLKAVYGEEGLQRFAPTSDG